MADNKVHQITISADSDDKGICWWQAICPCGWDGRWRARTELAREDGDRHLALSRTVITVTVPGREA